MTIFQVGKTSQWLEITFYSTISATSVACGVKSWARKISTCILHFECYQLHENLDKYSISHFKCRQTEQGKFHPFAFFIWLKFSSKSYFLGIISPWCVSHCQWWSKCMKFRILGCAVPSWINILPYWCSVKMHFNTETYISENVRTYRQLNVKVWWPCYFFPITCTFI